MARARLDTAVAMVFRGFAMCITRRAIVIAVTALTVSCGDSATAPRAGFTPPEPDFVVVSRTTTIAAHDDMEAVHRTTHDTLWGTVRAARKGRVSLPEAAPAPASAKGLGPAGFDGANPRLPAISLPARDEAAMCKSVPTYSRSVDGPSPSSTVRMTGIGDAPPSRLEVYLGNRLVATVERTWVRTARSWQLERQVTSSADGIHRDVVTYQHRTGRGEIAANAIPIVTCASPLAQSGSPASASRSYYAPRTMLPTGSSQYIGEGCLSDADYYSSDPCYDARMRVYSADAALVVAGTALTAACIWPVPVVIVTCTTANVAYLAAVANLAIAQSSLNNCRAEAARKKCSCQNQTALVPIGTRGFVPSRTADCSEDGWWGDIEYSPISGPAGGSGGSSSPGSGGEGCVWEIWEISYDGGATWSYYGTFRVCYVNAI